VERRLGHEHHVVDPAVHEPHGERDRDAGGDPVGVGRGGTRVDRPAGSPAERHRRGELGLDAGDATSRRRVAQPRPDPVDQGAVADRHGDDRGGGELAALGGVGQLEGNRRGAGRDPGVVAVDEHERPALRGVGPRRRDRRVEVLADLADVAPRAPHPGELAAVGPRRRETTGRTPAGPAANATPWPKFPADAQTTGRSGPRTPSRTRASIATHVPRPLNERIGLTVSTLTMTGTPSRADSPSWTNCGEFVNAGWIARCAARIASAERAMSSITSTG
jgi:hypothetical protein